MWIERLQIKGGTLDGFDQTFSPNLNVIIGGRGTGKSSVIELIRFCLAASASTAPTQEQATEHALGVLGDGAVTITLTDGKRRVEVSRSSQDNEPEANEPFVTPFVFSQAEIENIGLRSRSRLRLIDAFLPDLATSPDKALSSKVRSCTAEIRSLLAEIDDISEKTADLPKLQGNLDELKKQLSKQSIVHQEIVTFRKGLAEITPQLASAQVRAEAIGRVADQLSAWSSRLDDLLDRKPSFEPWPAQSGGPDELSELRKKEKQAYARVREGLDEFLLICEELEKKKRLATQQRTGLENRAREVRLKIEEKQKGASALDKQIADLTQRISVLNSLIDVRKERLARVKALTAQRQKLLSQQDTARQQRTERRQAEAKRLNKELAPAVRVRILPFSQRDLYTSAVASALRGSGLRYAELSEHIASTYSPTEISALAEARDTASVAATLEISEERAARLCDALRDPNACELFTTVVEDDVEIELMDGTDYKGIDFLSMGQRCTAVLPIILQHKERVIVLDQPEDHLDNAFVVGTLVQAVKERAAQTLVATHNPNIPVLGDAARVIQLDSDGAHCFVRVADSLNKPQVVGAITSIMEGGREAFARRAEFYSKHSPNAPKS